MKQISEASILSMLVPEIEDGYRDREAYFEKRHDMCCFQIHHFFDIHLGHRSPYQGVPWTRNQQTKRDQK